MVESSICSCSCTHCQNRSCSCSYCILIENGDDYDSSSGEESLPPPPPPPPPLPMSSSPSNRCQEVQYMDVAIQFNRFVLLLKVFWKWNTFTKCRKTQISSNRALLRRIVFKWRSYSEERIQIFRSVFTIEKIFSTQRIRILKYAFGLMMRHSTTFQFLDQCFETWRGNVNRIRVEEDGKLKIANEAYNTKRRLVYFQAWRHYTLVNFHQRKKEYEVLYRSFRSLKQWIKDSNALENQMAEIARNHLQDIIDRRIRSQFNFWVSSNDHAPFAIYSFTHYLHRFDIVYLYKIKK